MTNQSVLIVVANSTEAEIYVQPQRYATPQILAHSSADQYSADAPRESSDRPGRSFDSAGAGRHAMAPPSEPQRLAEAHFARKLVPQIERALDQQRCAQTLIIAPPRFLGALRDALPERVRKSVGGTVAKDLVGATPAAIMDELADVPRMQH